MKLEYVFANRDLNLVSLDVHFLITTAKNQHLLRIRNDRLTQQQCHELCFKFSSEPVQ
jgi:hypothetical protein